MAETFTAEIAGTVLAKLSSVAFKEICLIWGVQDEFQKLKDVLMAIKAVLVDAEEQQTHNRKITFWLQKFKDACYQVEDLVDEFEIETLRRRVLERGSTGRTVRSFFSSSNPLAFTFRMGRKIQKAKEMLDEITTNKSRFHLHEKHQVRNIIHSERETYSFVKASDVIGRDNDKENIIEFLMSPTDGEDIPVLSIVGIGGIGKTALAQLVFNDQSVKLHFGPTIWVCVTENFDVKQLMIKIIKSATGVKCMDMNKEELHKVLQDCLSGKRFCIVLDDVWNEDKKKWSELKDLLSGGFEGSKIIVTTRSRKTAAIVGTVPQCYLEPLSYGNSLSLFLKLAFKEGEEKQHKNLIRIGEEIVPKCKGVALAVKTLGSLLCSTRVEHDWEVVRDGEIWKLEHEENDILPALKLSYDQLPWHLKQCFAFCAVFPKGFEFNSLQLIFMWMANGFLQSTNKDEEPEDIGNRYIQELWSRSFFQHVEEEVFYFTIKMHDLVHDLALSVAQNEVSSFDHYSTGNVRHLWSDLSGQSASRLLNNLGGLRSLIVAEQKAGSESLIEEHISRSKSLRVLHLSDSSFEKLPNSVSYLKHLRYLSVYGNGNIERLPNSICKLQSLQTLLLGGCKGIQELPKDIRYMISLRTLCITTKQTSLQENGIGCLSQLQLLRLFACGNLRNLFEDMHRLTSLRILVIDECKNLVSLPRGFKYLTALETLVISDCEKLDLCMEPELEGKEDGRAGSLRKLYIRGLPKVVSLPRWIIPGSVTTLKQLYIIGLENLSRLPRWFQHLVSLQTLGIVDCPKLSCLPQRMQHLTALKELGIKACPKLRGRCMAETGKDWPKIAHVPQLYLSNDMETSTTDYDDE